MGEVNELVRIQVVLEGIEQSNVAIVELSEKSIERLKEAFKSVSKSAKKVAADITDSFDDVGDVLEKQLVEPAERAALSITQVRDAQKLLNQAFADSATVEQRQRIAQLIRVYDVLETEIVVAAKAQDLFETRLRGFDASSSAASASLIQLGRGVEDVRFGFAFAINNIEPFITSLRRVRETAAATGTTLSQQFLGALGGPAGLLFIFQALLTAAVVLKPAFDALFVEGSDEVNRLNDALDTALDTLLEIDRSSNIEFTLAADEGTLKRQLETVESFLLVTQTQIRKIAEFTINSIAVNLRIAGTALTATFDKLNEEEQEELENLKRREAATLRLIAQLEEQIALTLALAASTDVLRETETGEEGISQEAQRDATKLKRLRERLARELAKTRIELNEDVEARAIEKAEETFRKRLDLARELGDAAAIIEFEQALADRRLQISEEFADKREALERRVFRTIEAETKRAGDVAVREGEKETAALFKEIAKQEAERIRFATNQIQTNQRIARSIEREARETLREIRRIQRNVQRFTDAVADTFVRVARQRREITDVDIALEQKNFREEEAALRDSLNRRLISQEDFAIELAALQQERARFEKDVEKDRASFIARSAEELGARLIDIIAQETSKFIANQIARFVFAQTQIAAATATTIASMVAIGTAAAPAAAAVSIATFGGAAAAGTSAATTGILSITALVKALQASAGAFPSPFEEGGFTGNRNRHQIAGIVHGGEYVFPERTVRNDVRAFLALDTLLRSGVRLTDLLHSVGVSGFQAGGFVPLPESTRFFSIPNQQSPLLNRTNAEFRRLNEGFDALRRTVEELAERPNLIRFDTRNSRKLTQGTTVQRDQAIPRRFR